MNIRKTGMILVVVAFIVMASCGGGTVQRVVQEDLEPGALIGQSFNAQWTTIVGRDVDNPPPTYMNMNYHYVMTFIDETNVHLDTVYEMIPDTHHNPNNLQYTQITDSLDGTYTISGLTINAVFDGDEFPMTFSYGSLVLPTDRFIAELDAEGYMTENWPFAVTFYGRQGDAEVVAPEETVVGE